MKVRYIIKLSILVAFVITFATNSCSNDKTIEQDKIKTEDLSTILTISDLNSLKKSDTNMFSSFDTIVTNVYSEELNINLTDSLKLYFYDGCLKQLSLNPNIKNKKRKHIEFRSNGELYFIGEYLNDNPEGIFSSYDSTGTLNKLSIYIQGDKVLEYKEEELEKLNINPNWRKLEKKDNKVYSQ